MFALGRALFTRFWPALLLAGVAAVFPSLAVTWGTKLRWGYDILLLAAAVTLWLTTLIGWRGAYRNLWAWAGLGVVAGIGFWNDLLMVEAIGVVVIGLLQRGPIVGWARWARGACASVLGAGLGASPWVVANVRNGFEGFQHFPAYHVTNAAALRGMLDHGLPMIAGFEGTCESPGLPPAVAQAALALYVLAVLAIRARPLLRVLGGKLRALEPIDMVLLLGPVSLVPLVVSQNNGLFCEPRYAFLVCIPMALGLTLVILVAPPIRLVSMAAAAAWLAASVFSARAYTIDSRVFADPPAWMPGDSAVQDAARRLGHLDLHYVAANYWLARPVFYFSNQRVPIAPMGSAYPIDPPQATPDAWLVVDGEPLEARLQHFTAAAGISYTRTDYGSIALYRGFSRPVLPADVAPPSTSGALRAS